MSWSFGNGRLRHVVGGTAVAAGLVMLAVPVLADGTETLGPPSISIASGTGVAAAGVGMISQPGVLNIDVPAGAAVEQVLVYWEGFHGSASSGADDTIVIDSATVTGTLIGGPTFFFSNRLGQNWSSTYRADITALGLISPGSNTLTMSGLTFDRRDNGTGILVIYDDGSTAASIGLADGNDLAFINFAPTLDTTVPQTFTFDPAPIDRVADLTLFASSVADHPGTARPNVIRVTTGGVTTDFVDVLDSNDGDEWDTVTEQVVVPAGANSITMQALSQDVNGTGNLPASFAWIVSSAVVPTYVAPTTAPPTTAPPTTAPPTTAPPQVTTSSVEIAAVVPTTIPVATLLPATGSGGETMMTFGTLLVLLGGVVLLTSRRPRTLD